ncbi:hypothetical protein [Aquamicrobium soli]|uniref:Minor tail protein n=1 Tax=Aquamicrobium soli TaxID=1811518 RepID=A0ABV7KK46_9HYPH
MQRAVIDLPCNLGPKVSDWAINVLGRSAGDGVTGSGQVVYGAQPRWEATLTLSGFGRDRVLAWEAVRAKLKGRVNVLRVTICDPYRATMAEIGVPPGDAGETPHEDETLFDDGTGYDYEPTFRATETYERGAEELVFDPTSIGNALQPGQWFSHDDWPYKVTGIWQEDGGLARIAFEPPLRREIPEGADITLRATGLFAFESDLEGRLPRQLGKSGDATVNLVEWISRP